MASNVHKIKSKIIGCAQGYFWWYLYQAIFVVFQVYPEITISVITIIIIAIIIITINFITLIDIAGY